MGRRKRRSGSQIRHRGREVTHLRKRRRMQQTGNVKSNGKKRRSA
jgi:hypothetical protein